MRANAYAKINLGLVVGPLRPAGKHELATVLERVDLHDVIELEPAKQDGIAVEGFAEDTLVRRALELFAEAGQEPARWRVRIEKRIPLAAGVGGGSSDAATALRLANELVAKPLPQPHMHEVAAEIGSDVPFFLTPGAKLATGDGTQLESVELPREYWAVLALPRDEQKVSTGAVYDAVAARDAATEFAPREAALLDALGKVAQPRDLAKLPPNELRSAYDPELRVQLEAEGAFRVDLSGAGPTVYGLFEDEAAARVAEGRLRGDARTWLTRPVPGP